MQCWRLVPEARKAAAFTGEGSREYGGRWNPKGTAVVYLAEHLSLAALETYVHLPRAALGNPYLAYRVSFPESVVPDGVEMDQLPENWRTDPAPPSTQAVGQAWLQEGESLLLSVPSAIVPQESNLVVNLEHPDWASVTIGEPERFYFDSRLWDKP